MFHGCQRSSSGRRLCCITDNDTSWRETNRNGGDLKVEIPDRSRLLPLTLKPPRRSNVGSRPTEKMSRKIVEAMSARMPCGWGRTMTMARETSMASHSRVERWGSSVPEDEEGQPSFIRWTKWEMSRYVTWTPTKIMLLHVCTLH